MTYRLKDQKNNAAFYEISDKREIKPLTHYEEYMIWWKNPLINLLILWMNICH